MTWSNRWTSCEKDAQGTLMKRSLPLRLGMRQISRRRWRVRKHKPDCACATCRWKLFFPVTSLRLPPDVVGWLDRQDDPSGIVSALCREVMCEESEWAFAQNHIIPTNPKASLRCNNWRSV